MVRQLWEPAAYTDEAPKEKPAKDELQQLPAQSTFACPSPPGWPFLLLQGLRWNFVPMDMIKPPSPQHPATAVELATQTSASA